MSASPRLFNHKAINSWLPNYNFSKYSSPKFLFYGNTLNSLRSEHKRGGEHSGKTIGQLAALGKMYEYLSKWSGVRRNWMRENIFYFLACIPSSFVRENRQNWEEFFPLQLCFTMNFVFYFLLLLLSHFFYLCLNMHFMRKFLLKYERVEWVAFGGSSSSLRQKFTTRT